MTVSTPVHPASGLRDSLEAEGWSVNEFAFRMGISRNTASRLLNERCRITPDIALALESIGCDLALARIRKGLPILDYAEDMTAAR